MATWERIALRAEAKIIELQKDLEKFGEMISDDIEAGNFDLDQESVAKEEYLKLIFKYHPIHIERRLESLRQEIRKECISYGEIAELESLADYIEADDVELLQWAGVPEN